GWERVNRNPARPVDYRRDYYATAAASAPSCEGAEPGRKRVRWHAEQVHHFAFSLNPEYRYEGGRYNDVAVHVLYTPGDEESWGNGVAVERTERALAWLDRLFGPFGWPQLTNLHRIEGGGTEFPMVVMTGGADQGLIVHEVGHNYVQGLLANNEWREAWLDEGFTTFQSTWFWEIMGRPTTYYRNEATVLMLDLEGESEPPSRPAEDYRDFASYNVAVNTRGELFFHQLRSIVGDQVMHRILRTFYERWRYRHVDELAFRRTAEEVSGRDLSTFFAQWLHTTELYDYAVGKVETRRAEGSGEPAWLTRVEVLRKAPGVYPVDVAVYADGDTAAVRVEGEAPREWAEALTVGKPRMVEIDPAVRSHDWNMVNNRKRLGWSLADALGPPGTELYLHPYFSTRVRRDRLTVGFGPTLWYNETGGLTLGVRSRSDYLGRFWQDVTQLSWSTGVGVEADVRTADFFFRLRNPPFLRSPNLTQTLDVYDVEGRFGAAARVDWSRRARLGGGPVRALGLGVRWVHVDDTRFLDPGLYDDVGTVELELSAGLRTMGTAWRLGLEGTMGSGLAYNRDGLAAAGRTDLDPFYYRGTIQGTARRALGRSLDVGFRLFAGGASGEHVAAKQRQIYLQGADPLAVLGNPFLRSRGALLVGDDFRYHQPGGAGVRGIDPRVSAAAAVGLSAELERTLHRSERRLFSRVALAAFADGARAFGDEALLAGGAARWVADAGIGLRAEHRIGDTRFVTRFDFPLYVSDPALAHDRGAEDGQVAFRWTFGFEPSW
ncbi:MAG TPA: M1 family aminopeptidase, partial [Gemmatimonadales bacterium]|nr:M1 family aminopeptidase [Gemmatimonadales bacterium]